MPLMKGHSKEVVSQNIKEMIKSGHAPKQAVAASLASARKYKNMAKGKMVRNQDEDRWQDAGKMDEGGPVTKPSPAPSPQPIDPAAKAIGDIFKHNNLWDGGEVSDDMDEGLKSDNDEQSSRSLNEIKIQGDYHPNMVMNPEYQEAESMLAKHLYEKAEENEMNGYAMGGLVQDGPSGDEPVGNKPEEDMASSTGEPMSSEPSKPDGLEHKIEEGVPMSMGLSEEAKKALAEKKKARRFMSR